MLRIVPVDQETLAEWQSIHNVIIPTGTLTLHQVAERARRHRLTLAYDDGHLIGNGTVRPPVGDDGSATVIVRVLPAFRRLGRGTEYLQLLLADARTFAPDSIRTIVLASNVEGLAFATLRGFVEVDRYVLTGDDVPYVELQLP